MSTVILEVAEERAQEFFEMLENWPGVRVMNREPMTTTKPAYWQLLGKYKHTRVSSESLSAENEVNKSLEGE